MPVYRPPAQDNIFLSALPITVSFTITELHFPGVNYFKFVKTDINVISEIKDTIVRLYLRVNNGWVKISYLRGL